MAVGGVATLRRVLPPNCLCGSHDSVAGLSATHLPRHALSLLETTEDSPETQLLPSGQLFINNCAIKLPPSFEPNLLSALREVYVTEDPGVEFTIYEYQLHVASHNQWNYVNKAKLRNSIVLALDGDFLRCNGIPTVDGVFCSKDISIVFQLECAIRIGSRQAAGSSLSLTLGELVCMPSVEEELGQFAPMMVSEQMGTESFAWTPVWSAGKTRGEGVFMMCEISPYQGSVQGPSSEGILAAIEERKKIEETHKKWLKELNEKERVRELELKEKEKQIENKMRQVASFNKCAKSIFSSEEPSSLPHTPISQSRAGKSIIERARSPSPKPQYVAGEVKKPKEEVPLIDSKSGQSQDVILEAVGREIPRGDQIFLADQGASGVTSSATLKAEKLEENIQDSQKASKIFVEFLSLQPKGRFFGHTELFPRNITFSFKFFSFPVARTEALTAEANNDANGDLTFSLKIAGSVKNWTNIVTQHSDGKTARVNFDLDPSGDSDKETDKNFREFLKYLTENVCKIWLWDAESQTPFGLCKLPLTDLVRTIEPMRMAEKECDILSMEEDEVIGTLRVLLQNIGKKEGGPRQKTLGPAAAAVGSVKTSKRGKVKVRSKPLTVKDLAQVPQMSTCLQGDIDKQSFEERRKAQLVYAYKAYMAKTPASEFAMQTWEKEGLATDFGKYRTVSRAIMLTGMTGKSAQPPVEYKLGELQLFPVTFSNPYARETTFLPAVYDPEGRNDVKLVSDPQEWKQYCVRGGFAEPPDWTMLGSRTRFLMRPGEQVTLLFRVIGLSPPKNSGRVITITIYNAQTNAAEQANELCLQYKETCYHASYMFNVPESRSVDVALSPEAHADKLRKAKRILCSEMNVDTSISNNRLNLTFNSPASPNDTELYFFMYSDQYFLDHICTFYAVFRAYCCIDINEAAGKRIAQTVIIEGSQSARDLQVCSSRKDLVEVDKSLANGVKLDERTLLVPLSIVSCRIGRVQALLHAIDVEKYEVYRRWLIRIHTQIPVPVLRYEITAPAEETSQASFEYANANGEQKIFDVNSSNPNLIKILEPTLVLPPGEKGQIKVHVAPMETERQINTFVFVCDRGTGKAEAIAFSVSYITSNQ